MGEFCMLLMSIHVLLILSTEASTLLHRGITLHELPSIQSHPAFYLASFTCLLIHLALIIYLYPHEMITLCSNWRKVLLLSLCSLVVCALDIVIGVLTNAHDFPIYRRH